MPSKAEPELEVRFYNKLGYYLPIKPIEAEAAKARALIGHRKIKRLRDGHYLVDTSPGFQEPFYEVDLTELRCSCPPVRLHRVTICKHLVLCQWIEDAFS